MKKTLLDEQSKDLIVSRIMKLQPASVRVWGTMTVNEMLCHCIKVNTAILNAKQRYIQPTFKQKLLKTVGLSLMKQLPKGIKTNPKYFITAEDHLNFEQDRDKLIESINQLVYRKENIYGIHSYFGALNTQEWRRFLWMHTDHHLRQFSV